jgi:hypothetical protein
MERNVHLPWYPASHTTWAGDSVANENFFNEQLDQSDTKARIVQKYFASVCFGYADFDFDPHIYTPGPRFQGCKKDKIQMVSRRPPKEKASLIAPIH